MAIVTIPNDLVDWADKALRKNALSKADAVIVRHIVSENERLKKTVGEELLEENMKLKASLSELKAQTIKLRNHLDSYLAIIT